MHSRNAKLGLKLFSVYLVLYLGFVGINTFSTSTMELKPFAGINLAIWYGFALIVAAILLALIYGVMCDPSENEQTASAPSADASSDQEGGQA
ncbi:MAG: DUF485 domain-containing protein [Fuerstiella sp.]